MRAIETVSLDDLCADKDWWRIYDYSFPATEREPPNVIVESLRRGVGIALRARREGVTFGLATIHILNKPPAVFLVYLAVAQGDRSQGTGGELLRSAWESGADYLSRRGSKALGLIWEVDSPELDASDSEARRRRVAFFQRHGGQMLARRYLQPPVNGTTAIPMSLMFTPAEDEALPTPEVVESLVRAMYFEKYAAINGIDTAVLEDLLSRR